MFDLTNDRVLRAYLQAMNTKVLLQDRIKLLQYAPFIVVSCVALFACSFRSPDHVLKKRSNLGLT